MSVNGFTVKSSPLPGLICNERDQLISRLAEDTDPGASVGKGHVGGESELGTWLRDEEELEVRDGRGSSLRSVPRGRDR